jgi:hypothetical protein
MAIDKNNLYLIKLSIITLIIIIIATLINTNILFKVDYPEFDSIDFSKHRQLVFDDTFRGTSPESKITFVMFMDFDCPASIQLWHHIRQLMFNYTDINFVFKHLININDEEELYKSASFECGLLSGVGYDLADLMFTYPLTKDEIHQFIEGKNVNLEEFIDCTSNEEILKLIESDMYHASFLEVKGTPTIFIEGIKIEGAYNYEVYDEIIKKEIREIEEIVKDK